MLSRLHGFVATVVIAVLALSGVALAQDGDPAPDEGADETEDTGFNFAYDEIFQLFVFNLWDNANGPWDCALNSAGAELTYGVDGEGDESSVVVSELTIDGEAATFESTDDEADPPAEPLEYGIDNECTLKGVSVAGPNGQINHGMFMKLFNSTWDGGPGRGCVNRFLARSDLGKGDQQVTVSEAAEAEFTPVADGDTGEVGFTSVLADCKREKGNRDSGGDEDGDVQSTRGRGHNKGQGRGAKGDDGQPGNGNGNGNGRGNGNGNNGNGNSGNGNSNGRGHDR